MVFLFKVTYDNDTYFYYQGKLTIVCMFTQIA
ncbi:hypothetical protein LCGC14_1471080 [marine sediment metagenome]|uniref:Uncharacterized protein n=1 Tax=marine sediment metagenome TaxID=412755 RepID=A0A0F9JD00_9ZZZZ